MDYRKKFYTAQRCINRIDDLLEYRWRSLTSEQIRDRIMQIIDNYSYEVSDVRDIGEMIRDGSFNSD